MPESRSGIGTNARLAPDYICRIYGYMARYNNELEAFIEDTMFMDTCITNFNNIAQCAIRMKEHHPDEFDLYFPDEARRGLIGMRNILIHSYEHIDQNLVWSSLLNDLPRLESIFRRISDDHPMLNDETSES